MYDNCESHAGTPRGILECPYLSAWCVCVWLALLELVCVFNPCVGVSPAVKALLGHNLASTHNRINEPTRQLNHSYDHPLWYVLSQNSLLSNIIMNIMTCQIASAKLILI